MCTAPVKILLDRAAAFFKTATLYAYKSCTNTILKLKTQNNNKMRGGGGGRGYHCFDANFAQTATLQRQAGSYLPQKEMKDNS
jgi:hypothetical protein